jgi:hypothetical protein
MNNWNDSLTEFGNLIKDTIFEASEIDLDADKWVKERLKKLIENTKWKII